eukprot:GEMP01000678.1.p1 GENE.GEMP01000678.1~~GEMP01000678.1.p1  ORF type:complete len:795 (+),score=150.56 GEMP01000678.1:3399-5783(+)
MQNNGVHYHGPCVLGIEVAVGRMVKLNLPNPKQVTAQSHCVAHTLSIEDFEYVSTYYKETFWMSYLAMSVRDKVLQQCHHLPVHELRDLCDNEDDEFYAMWNGNQAVECFEMLTPGRDIMLVDDETGKPQIYILWEGEVEDQWGCVDNTPGTVIGQVAALGVRKESQPQLRTRTVVYLQRFPDVDIQNLSPRLWDWLERSAAALVQKAPIPICLESIPFFAETNQNSRMPANPGFLAFLQESAFRKVYVSNETIAEQGERCTDVIFIVSGKNVLRVSGSKKPTIVPEGGFIGEFAALGLRDKHAGSVKNGAGIVEAVAISRDRVLQALQACPSELWRFEEYIAQRYLSTKVGSKCGLLVSPLFNALNHKYRQIVLTCCTTTKLFAGNQVAGLNERITPFATFVWSGKVDVLNSNNEVIATLGPNEMWNATHLCSSTPPHKGFALVPNKWCLLHICRRGDLHDVLQRHADLRRQLLWHNGLDVDTGSVLKNIPLFKRIKAHWSAQNRSGGVKASPSTDSCVVDTRQRQRLKPELRPVPILRASISVFELICKDILEEIVFPGELLWEDDGEHVCVLTKGKATLENPAARPTTVPVKHTNIEAVFLSTDFLTLQPTHIRAWAKTPCRVARWRKSVFIDLVDKHCGMDCLRAVGLDGTSIDHFVKKELSPTHDDSTRPANRWRTRNTFRRKEGEDRMYYIERAILKHNEHLHGKQKDKNEMDESVRETESNPSLEQASNALRDVKRSWIRVRNQLMRKKVHEMETSLNIVPSLVLPPVAAPSYAQNHLLMNPSRDLL